MRRSDWYVDGFATTPKTREDLSDRLSKVLKFFSAHSFSAILDIGCGDGNFTVMLKEACHAEQAYGTDISKKAVELAALKGIKAFVCDIDETNLPFPPEAFDAIFCGEVIEHLVDPDHLLDEIHRTLKPGGTALITTPNLAVWYNRFALLFGYQPFHADVSYRHYVGRMLRFSSDGGSHLRMFTYRALRELLLLHGFQILKVQASHYHEKGTVPKAVILAEHLFSHSPSLSANPIFVVKKAYKSNMKQKG